MTRAPEAEKKKILTHSGLGLCSYELKGLCKDDVAVFVQFCAKSLLSSYEFLYSYIKCCCRVENKLSNLFKHFGDLSRHRIKTWKRWANVFKFQSLPSVTTDDRKQRQCLTIVFNNKTRSLFWEFNRYERSFCFFFCRKIANSVT